jgi:hypothetical protein
METGWQGKGGREGMEWKRQSDWVKSLGGGVEMVCLGRGVGRNELEKNGLGRRGREAVQLLLDKNKALEIKIRNAQALRSLFLLNRIHEKTFITLF